MPAPVNTNEFLDLVRRSGVVEEKRFDAWENKAQATGIPPEPSKVATMLVREGLLTQFQAGQILQGKWKRFTIGKYKILDKLGAGGMGNVFLCEHMLMRRRVAVKVLPTAKAADPASLQRFYREARAVAALDHPNIVHAYDIDQDEKLHFLVMEFVEGASFQDLVKRAGPLDVARACNYITQSAVGLEHAHQAGLVHRDIKPGNILVDRHGLVKILDMGLARFFNDEEDILTKKFDENVLGTADYLAPEQAIDSHEVDIRADIYSLGATFYYLLTGKTPFGEGTVAQKLMWHQHRDPKPIPEIRPDVPRELWDVILKMMAKVPEDRYAEPGQIVEALIPFTPSYVPPPTEAEMPNVAMASGPVSDTSRMSQRTPRPISANRGGANTSGPGSSMPGSGNFRTGATTGGGSGGATSGPVTSGPAHAGLGTTPAPATQSPASSHIPTPIEASAGPPDDANWSEGEMSELGDEQFADTGGPVVPRGRDLMPTERNKLLWIGIGVSALFLGVLVFLTFKYIVFAPVPAQVVREPLLVTQRPQAAGEARTYRSIREAMRYSKPGDTIILDDEVHAENLIVDYKQNINTDVILKAADGKKVTWTSKSDPNDVIIHFAGAQKFHLQGAGLTIDGKGETRDLILVRAPSAGLVIDGVTLEGFTRTAIIFMNAKGTEEHPIRVANIRTVSAPKAKVRAPIFLDAQPGVRPPFNDYIDFADSNLFDGFPGTSGIKRKDNTVVGKHVDWRFD